MRHSSEQKLPSLALLLEHWPQDRLFSKALSSLVLTSSDLTEITSQIIPESFPAMDKTGFGDLEKEFLVLDLNCWSLSSHHLENSRIHIWSRHKDCPRYDKGYLGRHVILDRDWQTAVGLGIRLSRNPIRHFFCIITTNSLKGIPLSIKCMRIGVVM